MITRLTAIVSGNVQRVGYRARVIDIANAFGFKGMIENQKDGLVKIIAEGDEEKLRWFESAIDIKNALIRVSSIEKEYSPATGDFENFGKLVLCPNGNLLRLPLAEQYGLTEQETHKMRWELVLDRGEALLAVRAILATLRRGYGWVYLWGEFGQGKTLMLKIAVAEALRARQFAAYVRMSEMVESLRATFDARDPSAEAERRLEWWTAWWRRSGRGSTGKVSTTWRS